MCKAKSSLGDWYIVVRIRDWLVFHEWGPFSALHDAEQCVTALAGRDNVVAARIVTKEEKDKLVPELVPI